MKKSTKVTACIVIAFGLAVWGCGLKHSASTTAINITGLPQDVLKSCTITKDSFNYWFGSHKATENGFVTPANSVTFPHNNNCDFYQWSERMFLWITSPNVPGHDTAQSILESPIFYNVSPPNAAGKRTLTAHQPGVPLRMSASLEKDGPDRLPVFKDKTGKLFEVEIPQKTAALIVNSDGKPVQVSVVKKSPAGAVQFLDKTGKEIPRPKAILKHQVSGLPIVQRFALGKQFVLLGADGTEIQTEAGQATGDVLMAQNKSLVYYLTLVNDVYAFFLSGVDNKQINGSQFPTTAAARDSICAIARAQHVTLPDSNALAIELKTSWVEASTLADPQNYFTIKATIPVYNTTSDTLWTPKSEKTVTMALVGIHIVGSVAGHPEMVWATFEHQKNTPNAAYAYLDSTQAKKIVAQDTGTNWLFSKNAADTAANTSHMINVNGSDTIAAIKPFTISPSNTLQLMPWGSAMDSLTNPENKSSAASNSEVISINNTIKGFLVGNDVRKNYLFIGATWTSGGAPPTGASYGSDTTHGVAIGTSVLANSTMETYFQTPSHSCFTCHSHFHNFPPTLNPDTISHVFAKIFPLYTNTGTSSKKSKK